MKYSASILRTAITSCLFLIPALYPRHLAANPVTATMARNLAVNWIRYQAADQMNDAPPVRAIWTLPADGEAELHIVAFSPGGFVIVSGDDALLPVIGYSLQSPVVSDISHPAVSAYLEQVQTRVRRVRADQSDNALSLPYWKAILDNDFSPGRRDRDVAPLLTTTWNQGCGYNEDCPVDENGPCDHVWAGCAATAMAQVMNYWSHPEQGTGSYSYPSDYGVLSANFGDTFYQWDDMPDHNGSDAIRELMYHCGVSVKMQYSPSGSGAWLGPWGTPNVMYALETYFHYDPALWFADRNEYTDPEWIALIRGEIESGRPVLYRGQGSGGHAFVCDGVQGDDYFHFNWGWSGYYDGYYYLNNLNPGGADFNTYQAALIDVFPWYPPNTPPTVTNLPDQVCYGSEAYSHVLLDHFVSDSATEDALIVWSWSGNAHHQVTVTDRVAIITPIDPEWIGSETITFRATDEGGLWDEGVISLERRRAVPVSDLQITLTDTDVQLDWSVVPDADSYHLTRMLTPFAETGTDLGTVLSPFLTLTGETVQHPEAFYRVEAVYGVAPFTVIFSGSFNMGQSGVATPEHVVTLTHDYALGTCEVTNREFLEALEWAWQQGYVTVDQQSVQTWGEELLDIDDPECEIVFDGEGFNFREAPSSYAGNAWPAGYSPANHPVQEVSWFGAACYCDWRSEMEGLTPFYQGNWNQSPAHNPYDSDAYRLPTEAEWEFAAATEAELLFPWGNQLPDPCTEANYDGCTGWTTPPGSFPAGRSVTGLHDMGGNLWEWCGDWYGGYTADSAFDPTGPVSGQYRVRRGGFWNSSSGYLRSAYRLTQYPETMNFDIGFRVCRTLN